MNAIQTIQAKLKNKNKLTHDVYELTYELDLKEGVDLGDKAGHFFMFNLNPKLKRAYSIAGKKNYKTYFFIIKRIPEGAGSPLICDANIGDTIEFIGPLGHFVLDKNKDKNKNKDNYSIYNTDSVLFIGTGTGFAPLFYQIVDLLENKKSTQKIHFIFGVRELKDVFYKNILDKLTLKYPNFTYQIYLSRGSKEDKEGGFGDGYVTGFLTKKNISNFKNFSICGSPNMVGDVRKKLDNFGINKEKIYFEQF